MIYITELHRGELEEKNKEEKKKVYVSEEKGKKKGKYAAVSRRPSCIVMEAPQRASYQSIGFNLLA